MKHPVARSIASPAIGLNLKIEIPVGLYIFRRFSRIESVSK